MKKAISIVLILMFLGLTTTVFARDEGNNGNKNEQEQELISINKNRNTNINDITSRNTNKNSNKQQQGQLQGQLQGQAQGQGQIANGKVEVTGDTTDTKVYANAWPSLSGGVGVSQANAYSIFGGLGVSNTEEYKVCIEKLAVLDTLVKLDYLTKDEAKTEINTILNDLKYNTKTKRFLGIFWKTSGRNLLNGLGLLSWDSFWSEGRTPIDILTTKKVK